MEKAGDRTFNNMQELVAVMRQANDLFSQPVSKNVLDSVEKVDRKEYGGEYNMNPKNVLCEQTMTAPYLHAMYASVFEQLAPGAETLLEVGCGPGTQAAILAHALPNIHITTTEIYEGLVMIALSNFKRDGLDKRIKLDHVGPGIEEQQGSFDCVSVACRMNPQEVGHMRGLVRPGGCLLTPEAPFGSVHARLRAYTDGKVTDITGVRFVPFQ